MNMLAGDRGVSVLEKSVGRRRTLFKMTASVCVPKLHTVSCLLLDSDPVKWSLAIPLQRMTRNDTAFISRFSF